MNPEIMQVLAILIGGGGLIGGAVAFIKMKPDIANISVKSAEGAVVVQAGVITSLKDEITRLSQDLKNEREDCQRKLDLQDLKIAALENLVNAIDERKAPTTKDINRLGTE
jgi:hypothetical protein